MQFFYVQGCVPQTQPKLRYCMVDSDNPRDANHYSIVTLILRYHHSPILYVAPLIFNHFPTTNSSSYSHFFLKIRVNPRFSKSAGIDQYIQFFYLISYFRFAYFSSFINSFSFYLGIFHEGPIRC